MLYQIPDILRDVRESLDLNPQPPGLTLPDDLPDPTQLALDRIIIDKVPDAARTVILQAPVSRLDPGHHFARSITWDEETRSGTIPLPDDYLRLIALRMSDWAVTLTDTTPADSPLYALQHQEFAGLRGTPQRPVCAVTLQPQGPVLRFWSCTDTSQSVTADLYQPQPAFDPAGGIELPAQLYRPIITHAAGLTAQALGDEGRAKSLIELAKPLIQ